MKLGNGLSANTNYNSRLQPTSIAVGSLLTLTYTYSATQNNGNVASQTINRGSLGSWTDSYGYDGVNRLTSAAESGTGTWSEGYSYSATGNRWLTSTPAGLPAPTAEVPQGSSWYQASNQITGWYYDCAGNITGIPVTPGSTPPCGTTPTGTLLRTATYDAENRMTSATDSNGNTTTYVYDGDGRRVQKTTPQGTTVFVYDPMGNLAQEYGPNSQSGTQYLSTDSLGSTRLVTDASGAAISCHDYLPFGEEVNAGTAGRTSCYPAPPPPAGGGVLFTGKERDAESGLDFFDARYMSSAQGRFTSTDPVTITTHRLLNPQELNLYAYVANNPLRFIDPTGKVLQCVGTDNQQNQCFADLQQIAGDAANRLSIDAKTGVVSFDTKDLDLSKNAGGALVNDLVGSKNTYDFSIGPTIMTDKGPVRIDTISGNLANLPTFGDQPKIGNPPSGVSDILGLNLNNPKMTRVSNTNLKVAPEWTVAFHELAEAYAKIDGGMGGSYAAGHNAALQREMELRDQRPYLKEYNTGAGGPANSPNPQGGIIIRK